MTEFLLSKRAEDMLRISGWILLAYFFIINPLITEYLPEIDAALSRFFVFALFLFVGISGLIYFVRGEVILGQKTLLKGMSAKVVGVMLVISGATLSFLLVLSFFIAQ